MTRGEHPGARLTARGDRGVEYSATGSLSGAIKAAGLASREVIAADNGKVQNIMRGLIVPAYTEAPRRHAA